MKPNRITSNRLPDEYIRRELQIAFEQVDRGEVSDLDMAALLAEAHRRYSITADRRNEREH